jgi:hypothetical protein
MIRSTQRARSKSVTQAPRSKLVTRPPGDRSSHRAGPRLTRREPKRIRVGRVLSAQARIAAGHYDRPEVKEYLVDALLDALLRH